MMLWSLPLLPVVSAIVIVLLRRPRVAAVIAIGGLVLTIVLALTVAITPRAAVLAWWGPHLPVYLAVVGFTRVMCVLVPSIAAVVVLYAIGAPEGRRGSPRLLALLLAFTGAMELLVIADDFLTLLVGWELVGACSWALIGYEWRDVARARSARNAYVTTRSGDLGLYIAAAAAFSATGSLRFDALGGMDGPLLAVVTAGIVLAAVAKSAQLPFSPWLFSAMAGPTPASALLHSATMVAAGAYLLARLAPVLHDVNWFGPTVAAFGIATALAGGVVASLQSDLKKALAASTSAQYGLMFVAIGMGMPAAADLHLVTHAVFKALLFLGAGVALHAAGTLSLEKLQAARLGNVLPRVALFLAAGTLALAGIPPLGAAFSKEQIVAAGSASGGGLEAAVLLASLLSAFYATRLQLMAFARSSAARSDRPSVVAPPSAAETASLAVLGATCAALGIIWARPVQRAFEGLLGSTLAPIDPSTTLFSLGIAALGIIAASVLARRDRLATLAILARVRYGAEEWFGIPVFSSHVIVKPVLALARFLAMIDTRVVDAGIRATTHVAVLTSRALAWWGERGFDGIVRLVALFTTDAARVSSRIDDRGIDRAIEGVARDVGRVGEKSRALQTGLAHWYYVLVVIGTLVVLIVAAANVVLRGR